MGETVYRIEQIHAAYPDWERDGYISKAELKRRLAFIRGHLLVQYSMDEFISILLHGDGKEKPKSIDPIASASRRAKETISKELPKEKGTVVEKGEKRNGSNRD